MKIADWLDKTRRAFDAADIATARLDAEVLLSFALGVNRAWLIAHGDDELTEKQLKEVGELVKRRLNREPIAHLLGHKEFYGRDFMVTKDTLVPRPESETLIDISKELFSDNGSLRAIDVGTGSGCLGITLKCEIPQLQMTLSDVSPEALAVAKQNAIKISVDVTFSQRDLLSAFTDTNANSFDFIVANLPYVDASWEGLSPELDHEPAMALFADDEGLLLIKKLIDQAPKVLNKNGCLLLEADPVQHPAIVNYAKLFDAIKTRDYAVVLRLK